MLDVGVILYREEAQPLFTVIFYKIVTRGGAKFKVYLLRSLITAWDLTLDKLLGKQHYKLCNIRVWDPRYRSLLRLSALGDKYPDAEPVSRPQSIYFAIFSMEQYRMEYNTLSTVVQIRSLYVILLSCYKKGLAS